MIFFGKSSPERFSLSPADDIAYGLGGADKFEFIGLGVDFVFGGAGADAFVLVAGADNVLIRGGRGEDILYLDPALLAEGEAANLYWTGPGALFQLADGGVLDIRGVELVEFL